MKKVVILCSVAMLGISLSACAKKKPIGSYQAAQCETQCTKGECKQTCVGIEGNYYKK